MSRRTNENSLKINKTTAFFGLMMFSSGVAGSFITDQKNISKVEMPTVDDPCNIGGTIYSDCKGQTQGKSYYEFSDCMEKVGTYSNRNGDLCCPDTDPTKEFYDCQPTPPNPSSSGGGMTPLQKGLLSGGIIILGLAIAWGAKKAKDMFFTRPTGDQVRHLLQDIVQGQQVLNGDAEQNRPIVVNQVDALGV